MTLSQTHLRVTCHCGKEICASLLPVHVEPSQVVKAATDSPMLCECGKTATAWFGPDGLVAWITIK